MAEFVRGTVKITLRKFGVSGPILYPALIPGRTGVVRLETRDLDFEAPNNQKYIDMVVLDLESDDSLPGLAVFYCIKNRMRDADDWIGPIAAVAPDTPMFEIRQTSRYFKFRIEDSFPLEQWKLTRMQFYGQLMEGRA